MLVAVDPNFAWRPHAASFSTFIACQIWDHHDRDDRVLLVAQASELAPADLAFLRERFLERPTTHGWPTKNISRFERDDVHVLIWDGDGQADWHISAVSDEEVAAVARELRACGKLRTSLHGVDDRGEHIVRALREQEGAP